MTDDGPSEDGRGVVTRRLGRGLAGAAVLIGVITIFARVAGFGRTAVFAQTVRAGCLGDTYNYANMIPNIVFEIVAGGALASMVVPVLAGPIERGESDTVRRTSAALLTWVTVALLPLSLLAAVLARPLMSLFMNGEGVCTKADMVNVGTHMLIVFAPQIVLYGLTVVLYGVLQAHRRFFGPALAPLLSSLVVIGAYLLFMPLSHGSQSDLTKLTTGAELTLSAGTTLGVVALVVTAGLAALPLRLRLRPTLTFPPGVARRVRRLAVAGLATVIAQQLATLVVMFLSKYGRTGTLTHFQFAWAVFLLPWAILVVPIATSAFPALSAKAEEPADFDRLVTTTTRAVILVSCAGAGVLAAASLPTAYFFDAHKGLDPIPLARAVLAFAPGLLGYGLVAHLGRVLFACHRGRESAGATVIGWAVVAVTDAVLVAAVPKDWVVAAFGIGNSVGMTVAGALLLAALVRARGPGILAGLARATVAGVAGAVAGGVAGYALANALGSGGLVASVLAAVAAAAVAAAVFAVVVFVVDGRDLRAVLNRRMS